MVQDNSAVTKVCSKCRAEKPLSAFGSIGKVYKSTGLPRLKAECRKCYRARPCVKIGQLRHRLKKIGMTVAEYNFLVAVQGGRCAICKLAPTDKRGLHLDHNHVTMAIRRLLCFNCNIMLGYAKENPAVLRRAADYIQGHAEMPSFWYGEGVSQ